MEDISLLDSVSLEIIIYWDSNYYKYIHSGMNFSFIQYVLIIVVALTRSDFEWSKKVDAQGMNKIWYDCWKRILNGWIVTRSRSSAA